MKIAFCLEYPIVEAGGVSVLVRSLIDHFSENSEVVLVSPDSKETLARAKLAGSVRRHICWSPQSVSRRTATALAGEIAGSAVDLAHFHFGANYAWSNRFPARCPIPPLARRGVPIVTTNHMTVGLFRGYCGDQKPFWFKLAFLPLAWLGKMRVLRHVRREIAVSDQDLARLRRWYWPFRNRFTRIYHSRLMISGKDGESPAREPVILAVGHLAHRKGQVILAEAFARIAPRHPEWKLLLAGHTGEESCRQAIETIRTREGVRERIVLLGQREDSQELMRRAAIYVQPSFHEGLPLSLQEALYHGAVCVATRIAGNTELVEDGRTGLLVPPGDPAALAAALERLMGDVPLRQELAARGHADMLDRGMTLEQMIQNHRQLYDAILGPR